MKCIHCDTDTPYPDRNKNGNRCKGCSHPFVFEPKRDKVGTVAVTDGRFRKAIEDVSGNGSVAFTEPQLWHEFCRKVAPPTLSAAGCIGILLAVFGLVSLFAWPGPIGPLALLTACGIAVFQAFQKKRKKQRKNRPVPLEYGRFKGYFQHWIRIHGAPEKLVRVESGSKAAPLKPDPELLAYSFDRALICDSDDVVAMLIANRFHFENNCALLSRRGYPHEIFKTVMEMLRRNPQLKVFALHEASVEGCRLPGQLRGEEWFPDSEISIIDLGLRPSHARKLGLFVVPGSPVTVPAELAAVLPPEDVKWLEAGNEAHLSALRPAKLMRCIYQGFAQVSRAAAPDGDGIVVVGDGGSVWSYDHGADLYASDSFG